MVMTAQERQAACRARRIKDGLLPVEVYLSEADRHLLKQEARKNGSSLRDLAASLLSAGIQQVRAGKWTLQ